MGKEEPEMLSEIVLYQKGCFMVVKRWLRGIHPDQGQITYGYTGWETVQEKTVIRPTHTFYVKEPSSNHS